MLRRGFEGEGFSKLLDDPGGGWVEGDVEVKDPPGYCQLGFVEARGGAVEGDRLQDSAGTRLLAPRTEGAISEHSVVG